MMPFPLKAGYNFDYRHCRRAPRFETLATESYADYYGLLYTISGDNLCYSQEGVFTYKAGDISFIPPNACFCLSHLSDTPQEEILLKFTDTMVSDLLEVMNAGSFDELLNGQTLTIHLEESERKKVWQIMKEMEREWNSYNKYSEIILKGYLNQLIIFCLKRQKSMKKNTVLHRKKKQDKLMQAIEYIKTNFAKNPSLQETAGHIHVSASYLSKIFIDCLHTPYSVFVLNEKIMYAQKLLVDSKMSMAEIAGAAGFSGSAYFSDCFKRITGTSPLQFRKAYTTGG